MRLVCLGMWSECYTVAAPLLLHSFQYSTVDKSETALSFIQCQDKTAKYKQVIFQCQKKEGKVLNRPAGLY